MTSHVRNRGLTAVRAEGPRDLSTFMNHVADGVEAMKRRNEDRFTDLQAQIADLATRAASRGLGGGEPGEQTVERGKISAAFREYIQSGDLGALKDLHVNAAMSVGSDPEGGYTVLPTFSSDVTRKVFESSPLRRYARVVQINSDIFEEPLDVSDLDASWVGEKAARPETDAADLGMLKIPVHEMYAMPKVTQKLLDDSSLDLAGWLVGKISSKFARKETAAFFTGTGVQQPRGFLTYPTATTDDDTRPWGTIQYVASGNASDFAATDPANALIDLQTSLKSDYRNNAVWLMNRRTAGKVRKFKDGDGNYLWQTSALLGQPSTFLGHPVVLCEDMPDVEANAYPVAFGDFGAGYTIVDRLGERVLRDPFTAKPNVLFYSYRRVGGDVNNSEAIKLLKIAGS